MSVAEPTPDTPWLVAVASSPALLGAASLLAHHQPVMEAA
jgi:hypothetical protein